MKSYLRTATAAAFQRLVSLDYMGVLLTILFVLTLIAIILGFKDTVARFHGSPFDGVFQTLFPLRRMDVGELPGIHFFYFHGNGIPYLLYPIYYLITAITGQELYASIWSTFVVNLIFLYAPIYLFFSQAYGKKWGLASVIVISFLGELFFIFGFYNSPLFIGAPMGVRMAPHLFALVVLNWKTSANPESELTLRRVIVLGAIIGLAPFLGAEQGVYAGIGVAVALFTIGNGLLKRIRNVMYFSLSGGVIFLATQAIIFGGLETISAMKIISENQVWVFGVFPNTFYTDLLDIFSFAKTTAVPSQIMTLLATLFIGIFFSLWLKRIISEALFTSLIAMYAGGLVSWLSNIGYVGHHQSAILFKLVLIAIMLYLVHGASQLTSKQSGIEQNG